MTSSAAAGCEAFDDVFLVGYGETPFHKRDAWEPLRYLADTAQRTLADADVGKEHVDGLGTASFVLTPDNLCTVAEHLVSGCAGRWRAPRAARARRSRCSAPRPRSSRASATRCWSSPATRSLSTAAWR